MIEESKFRVPPRRGGAKDKGVGTPEPDALLKRLVETSNPKVVGAFETKIAKLEKDKLLLAEKLAQDTQSALPLGKIIELLRDFLSNPWNIYEKGSLLACKTILKASFRAPSAYNRKTGYRTPQTSVIFRFLGDLKEKCEMVRSRNTKQLNHSRP